MSKYVFGIDLGTTYSCISYVDETGRPVVVSNSEGTNTTPSVVNFASANEVVVGQVAKENAVIDPNNTVSLVKTLMGKTDYAITYNGEDKSPEEVSAYILRKVTEDAAKMIDSEVKDVVITCPAYFGTAERTATKNAGIIAGLNVLEIISEPTAAALYYGCAKEQSAKTVLVFDLGGGTFDVTIMSINSEKIEVVCSDGNHDLGGKNWDEAVMRYLLDEFIAQTGFSDEIDEYAQQDLRLKAEKAKQQLSSREEVPVMLDIAGQRARISLKREKFDEITSMLLNEAIDKTDAAIAVAKEKGYSVDEILLVGGSTRMPQVTKTLTEKYGMEPKILEPDEAVAKGAAIHAVNVYVNNQKNLSESDAQGAEDYKEDLSVKPEMMSMRGKMQQVIVATTKSFSVAAMQDNVLRCFNLITKNESMPEGKVEHTEVFETHVADQRKVKIQVYETDFMEEVFDVDEEFLLGETELDLPAGLPKGEEIGITFVLNSEGILEVKGMVVNHPQYEVKATMHSKGIMDESKVTVLAMKSKKMVVS